MTITTRTARTPGRRALAGAERARARGVARGRRTGVRPGRHDGPGARRRPPRRRPPRARPARCRPPCRVPAGELPRGTPGRLLGLARRARLAPAGHAQHGDATVFTGVVTATNPMTTARVRDEAQDRDRAQRATGARRCSGSSTTAGSTASTSPRPARRPSRSGSTPPATWSRRPGSTSGRRRRPRPSDPLRRHPGPGGLTAPARSAAPGAGVRARGRAGGGSRDPR